MLIHLLEPFFAGSHATWAKGLQEHSHHKIDLLTLPGRHWKWRMFSGAVALAEQIKCQAEPPDLILATDMLDLAGFLGHTRQLLNDCPTVLYMHENQVTYPWSANDQEQKQWNNQYGYINFTSALAADQIWFNSTYHQEAFFVALPEFLQQFPDQQQLHQIPGLQAKSRLMPLGLDLQALLDIPRAAKSTHPLITWNHRWEYDKDPRTFFQTLFRLQEEGLDFRLAVLGEHYAQKPPIFAEAKKRLSWQIIHWGFAETDAYHRILGATDFLPVTSRQDFFGGSLVEGIAAGAIPLVPNRLAFPEHIPAALRPYLIFQNAEDLFQKLKKLLSGGVQPEWRAVLRSLVARYDWRILAPVYDQCFSDLLHHNK